MRQPLRTMRYAPAVLCMLMLALPGCYTAAELRELSASKPDPRAAQVNALWDCVLTVAQEEMWPVDVESRPDLLLATRWMDRGENKRERVRITVIVAPRGVGINVNVNKQHKAPDADAWYDVTDPAVLTQKRAEETAIAKRIQRMWKP
jgi:hypothetical protein